ncbi:hypothetical protein [Ferrimonas balearica]|uniref:hypothetical protein n=1 Tax=Ferrimonas balearica TaxID=44012 RepID=UPI001C99C623|nr:hypothetical protein [Ferrimonas balearica]MBY5993348.1 hypothetical protein [Ferrimonas balearica]
MKLAFLAAPILLLSACSSTPDTAANGDDPQAQQAQSDSDIICRAEKITGSHIRKRRCRTRAQMEAEAEMARKQVADTLQSGSLGSSTEPQ